MTRRPRGFALVTVIWIAALLGLFLIGISAHRDQTVHGAQAQHRRAEAQALTEAAFARALWVLKTKAASSGTAVARPIRPDGLVWRDNLSAGRIAVRIVPADALIDLNFAAPSVLSALAEALARRMGPDQRPALRQMLTARQGAYDSIGALQDDLAPLHQGHAALADVLPLITVGSARVAPDMRFAPPQMFEQLLGLSADAVAQIIEDRRAGQLDAPVIAGAPAPDYAADVRPRGPVWHVSVAARTTGGGQTGWMRVIYLPLPEEQPDAPYFLLESHRLSGDDPIFTALTQTADAP